MLVHNHFKPLHKWNISYLFSAMTNWQVPFTQKELFVEFDERAEHITIRPPLALTRPVIPIPTLYTSPKLFWTHCGL